MGLGGKNDENRGDDGEDEDMEKKHVRNKKMEDGCEERSGTAKENTKHGRTGQREENVEQSALF